MKESWYMKKTEIEEIKNFFDSIICLAVEGPDIMRCIMVVDKIAKEAKKGYNLCDAYLTNLASSGNG